MLITRPILVLIVVQIPEHLQGLRKIQTIDLNFYFVSFPDGIWLRIFAVDALTMPILLRDALADQG
jgi:hypothetical protein